MFEVIKILIVEIFKMIDVNSIVNRIDKNKKSFVGQSLFHLYHDLNHIYITGITIVDEIDALISRRNRYLKEGRVDEPIRHSALSHELRIQRENLYSFEQSFEAVALLVDVLDPEVTRRLSLFLCNKINVINLLNGVFPRHRDDLILFLDGPREQQVVDTIKSFFKSDQEYRFGSSLMGDNLLRAVEPRFEDVDLDNIAPNHLSILEKYLELRKPRAHLEELKDVLHQFRTALLSHFDVEDILIHVGDKRSRRGRLGLVFWRPTTKR